MRSYRIGKTLKIRWGILTGGKSEPLSGRDLRLEIATGSRFRRNVPFEADDSVAEFLFQGSEQRYVGAYTLTMWENRGKENQTVVDRCDAFCLVACSCEESAESADEPNLDVETLELGSSNLETGVPGKSAYELFKEHNPDSELTEEQYAEAPVQAAEAALAMVEQLEKTDAAVKQAEQLREQAEQGREASEQNRAVAEQTRVTAEQQRVLAEQTRATNESTRQTAEAGRQAAETKREENTAEAIRNIEEATRKAEDEAARVRTLADNPPKIVEVNGMAYWAFYDLETEQYVTSQHRADDGTIVQQVEGADVSLDVVGGTMYVCGELTSLTIASVENSTKPSIIRFTSGATATQFSYPENFNITGWTKPEENRNYTICILFGAGNMTYDE
jgi:flagellar biosynthesis GTPase FlhF|nr:MAG TPA: MAEBL protein [Caudoviricetes sp.]